MATVIAVRLKPPPPPLRKQQDTTEAQPAEQEERSEESGIESVREKLHQALTLIVEATSELDDLEQQSKGG